jgi:hypothetical protein
MKKRNFKPLGSLLLAVVWMAGCQKDTLEKNGAAESNAVENSAHSPRENSCRTTVFDWQTFAKFEFHYNEKGLADQWNVDYGPGYPLHTNDLVYDDNDRLVQSNEVYFGLNNVWHFYYTGELLTHITRDNPDVPEMALEILLTYDNKGQNTRQDDELNDYHTLMTYDNMGNCIQADSYLGDELVYSDIYTFSLPVRNPRAAVPGIDLGFLFAGPVGFTDKRHFTSNRTDIYVNGDPFVFNDYDPARTVINTGNHNYPISATYYDRISDGTITVGFDYENCNGNGSTAKAGTPQGKLKPGINNSVRKAKPLLLRGSQKSMREQIQRMKEQLDK